MTRHVDQNNLPDINLDQEEEFKHIYSLSRRKILCGAVISSCFYLASTGSGNAQSLPGFIGELVGSAIREAQRQPRQIERGGGGRRPSRKRKSKAKPSSRGGRSGGGKSGGGPAGPQAPE